LAKKGKKVKIINDGAQEGVEEEGENSITKKKSQRASLRLQQGITEANQVDEEDDVSPQTHETPNVKKR
jgi:hypothetical protein